MPKRASMMMTSSSTLRSTLYSAPPLLMSEALSMAEPFPPSTPFRSLSWMFLLRALNLWRAIGDEKATWTNSGWNSRFIILVGKCCLLALWRATEPSSQQVTSRSPIGEYAIALIGFSNCLKLSQTQVFSISKTRIAPDWKPQEKIERDGWAATQRG